MPDLTQLTADPQAPARHRADLLAYAQLLDVEVTRERRTR